MTKQEMFNLAVRGLASQGWEPAVDNAKYSNRACVYETPDGKRCAWGWVDRSLTSADLGTVASMHHEGRGLAGRLHGDTLAFARRMQYTHDDAGLSDSPAATKPGDLLTEFIKFARIEGVEWPADVPRGL